MSWDNSAGANWESSNDNQFTSTGGDGSFENTGADNGFGENSHGGDENAGGGGACRNCDQEGHFARECPQPRQMTGECFNCGQMGHSKADCTNPRVTRAFTGTCRSCNEQGHMASDCPSKPAEACRNCKEPGHTSLECTKSRTMDLSKIEDKDSDEAWSMLAAASADRDMDDFKEALAIYSKAQPELTYQVLEKKFRAANFSIYLIASEKEIPLSITLVNLQGKQDCKFTIGYNFSTQPKRAKFAEGWPSSVEENLERLADAGEAMDQLATLCRNCKELGHMSKNCPQDKVEFENKPDFKCDNCQEEGHRLRDCPKPRVDRNACKNCGQLGHRAADCTEERSAENVECRKCSEMGHFSKDCPTGGGPRTCRNCGSEDHIAKECDQPRNPETVTCRNCDELGHLSRECPKPRDYSRVKCSNCGEMGHTKVRCKQAAADEGGNDGFGDAAASGGGGFDTASNNFGQESAAASGDWNAGVTASGW